MRRHIPQGGYSFKHSREGADAPKLSWFGNFQKFTKNGGGEGDATYADCVTFEFRFFRGYIYLAYVPSSLRSIPLPFLYLNCPSVIPP